MELGPYGLSSGQMVKLIFALRVSDRVTGVRTHPCTHTHTCTLSPFQSFGFCFQLLLLLCQSVLLIETISAPRGPVLKLTDQGLLKNSLE